MALECQTRELWYWTFIGMNDSSVTKLDNDKMELNISNHNPEVVSFGAIDKLTEDVILKYAMFNKRPDGKYKCIGKIINDSEIERVPKGFQFNTIMLQKEIINFLNDKGVDNFKVGGLVLCKTERIEFPSGDFAFGSNNLVRRFSFEPFILDSSMDVNITINATSLSTLEVSI